MKPIVVNLLGSPGTGKSTIAAEVFAKLKWAGINCELVTEFAKDLTWERRTHTLQNQIYIFGKQHHRLFRLHDKVDVIITDSPLILSGFYDSMYGEDRNELTDLIRREVMRYENMNYFLNRTKPYNPKGRNQTEEESNMLSVSLKEYLSKTFGDYKELLANDDTSEIIINDVLKCKSKRNTNG